MSLDIDNMGKPYTTSNGMMSINLQPLVAKTTMGFFGIENTDGNYGLSQKDIDEILQKPEEEQINTLLEKKGLPKTEDPGLSSLLSKFSEMIADAISKFGSYFVTLAKAINLLIELLKNPTKASNIKKIGETITGLKELIQSVIKFFTDTVEWAQETFLGPLADVKIPSPMFTYQMVEHVPPMPFPIPIPPLNVDLKGKGAESINLKKLDPKDFTKTQLLFNTPYLYLVPDTNLLIKNLNMSPENTELAASQLKTTQMFKNVVSFPIKVLIGFINKLLSAITGAISFNFSEFKGLIEMMIPTLTGIMKLFGTIVDGIVPNFSKSFEQMNSFINSNNLDFKKNEDISKLENFTKNLKIDTEDSTSEFDKKLQEELDELENSINDIIEKKENFSFLNKDQLKDYLDFLRGSEKGIQENFKNIGELSSQFFLPDHIMINTNFTQPIFDLIGITNKLDFHTFSKDYEPIYNQGKPIEDRILNFYSTTTENVSSAYNYLNLDPYNTNLMNNIISTSNNNNMISGDETIIPNLQTSQNLSYSQNLDIEYVDGSQTNTLNIINSFFNQFKNTGLPQETLKNDILIFLSNTKKYLTIENENIINNYFDIYNKQRLIQLKETTEKTIKYVENVEEIKGQVKNLLNNTLLTETINLVNLTLDLKDEAIEIGSGGSGSSIIFQISNNTIDNLRDNYLSLLYVLNNSYINYLSLNTNIDIKQKLNDLIDYMVEDYNNFEYYNFNDPFQYTLNNSDNIIQLCVELITISYNKLFLVTNISIFNEISELNLGVSSTFVKENIILSFLKNFRNALNSNLEFINDDESNENIELIDTLKMLLIEILTKVEIIKNNDLNLKEDFKTKSKTTLDQAKKMSTTPPPVKTMGTYAQSYVNIMKNFPKMLLDILKSIFEFVFQFLPF